MDNEQQAWMNSTTPEERWMLRLCDKLREKGLTACPDDRPGWLLVDDGTGEMELVAATSAAVHQRLYGY